MKIFRYMLKHPNDPWQMRLEVPLGTRVLSVAPDRDGEDSIDLWALVPEDESTMVAANVIIVGTGREMPEELIDGRVAVHNAFVGSCIMYGFVWHVFVTGLNP